MQKVVSTHWVANDGTIFENENDCESYEEYRSIYSFKMFDDELQPCKWFIDAYYILIKTDTDAENLKLVARRANLTFPEVAKHYRGLICYDWKCDKWFTFDELKAQVQAMENLLANYDTE